MLTANTSAPAAFCVASVPRACLCVMATLTALAWHRYNVALRKQPLATKAITSGCIAALSDVIAQRLAGSPRHNWLRTLQLALFGLVWSGPSAHFWQKLLERIFQGKNSAEIVLKKVMIDQLTYGPVCNVLLMSYLTCVVQGCSVQDLKHKLVRDFARVQSQGWKLWPAAGLVNYRYVPLNYRVLFVNLVALCWSSFLILQSKRNP